MDLTQTSLLDIRNAVASREISAREVCQGYLDRIDRINPAVNAYHEVYADRAMQRAKAVDDGQVTGPLAGVPIALKDLLCTEWGKTTCSSRMLEHYESPFTATAVQRLEDAGAVMLGKTNMDEFAMGSSSEHGAFGRVHNPWSVDHVPGGSSGGSAAAIGADLCAGAIGTDTGGSIRQPASFCGVVGLKPSYGRISRWGLVAFASSLDQIGPMTHTAADAALLLGVMAGHDRKDTTCADLPVPDYLGALDQPPAKLRLGLAKQYLSESNSPAVAAAVDKAIAVYRDLGAEVVEVDLPHTEYGVPTYYIVAPAEASSNLARYDGVHYGRRAADADDLMQLYARSRAQGFGDEVKQRIMLGAYALSSGYYDAYYLRALKVRRLIKQDFDTAFQQCDAILCPVTTEPAFRIGAKIDDPLAMYLNDIYTVNCNLAGLPGVSLPGAPAVDAAGPGKPLPVGVQLIGPAFAEDRLLAIAHQYQQAVDFHHARPPLPTA